MTQSISVARAGSIRIGCAGWSLRRVQSQLFGQGSSHLARYATRFDTVEINSSFYRSHQQKTYARWAAAVPGSFRFSVKMPKVITHAARLIAADEPLTQFSKEIAGLGDRLGGVLVQLPPTLKFDELVAETFFRSLRRQIRSPVACEARHPSWFTPEVDRVWQSHAVTRAAADPAHWAASSLVGGAGPWRYWRWHGSPRMYYSRYDESHLRDLADQLQAHAAAGRTAWCILDNTALGHAVTDAIRLQELCGTAIEVG